MYFHFLQFSLLPFPLFFHVIEPTQYDIIETLFIDQYGTSKSYKVIFFSRILSNIHFSLSCFTLKLYRKWKLNKYIYILHFHQKEIISYYTVSLTSTTILEMIIKPTHLPHYFPSFTYHPFHSGPLSPPRGISCYSADGCPQHKQPLSSRQSCPLC